MTKKSENLVEIPRGAEEKLLRFAELLVQANATLNLVAKSTLANLWERHILDSVQLLPYAGRTQGVWLDLGSGGGLPGLVIALCSAFEVHLVEKSPKKCCFLRAAVDTLQLTRVIVHQVKLEASTKLPSADIISARAFAPLPKLMRYLEVLLNRDNRALCPRGRQFRSEMADVDEERFRLIVHSSKTAPDSGIFQISRRGL